MRVSLRFAAATRSGTVFMADPADPALGDYFTQSVDPSIYAQASRIGMLPAQSGIPAAPQAFQQGNGNLATKQLPPTAPPNYSPFERDLLGAFSGLGGYLSAAAQPVANTAQRVGAYLGGTPQQASALEQHINAQQYLGSTRPKAS